MKIIIELLFEFMVAVYKIHIKPKLEKMGISGKDVTEKMVVAVDNKSKETVEAVTGEVKKIENAFNREAKKAEANKYCEKCVMQNNNYCFMYKKETCDCIDECKSYGEVPELKKEDRLNIKEELKK